MLLTHEKDELLVRIARVNADKGYSYMDERERLSETIFGDCDPDELRGEVYRHAVEEYGRCTGKVYVDSRTRGTIHVGWCFVKREKYDDCDDTYLCETWVTLERVVEPAHPTTVTSVNLENPNDSLEDT